MFGGIGCAARPDGDAFPKARSLRCLMAIAPCNVPSPIVLRSKTPGQFRLLLNSGSLFSGTRRPPPDILNDCLAAFGVHVNAARTRTSKTLDGTLSVPRPVSTNAPEPI